MKFKQFIKESRLLRYWVSPKGQLIQCGGSHEDTAERMLDVFDAFKVAMDKGYVRVSVEDGVIYYNTSESGSGYDNPLSRKAKETIIDLSFKLRIPVYNLQNRQQEWGYNESMTVNSTFGEVEHSVDSGDTYAPGDARIPKVLNKKKGKCNCGKNRTCRFCIYRRSLKENTSNEEGIRGWLAPNGNFYKLDPSDIHEKWARRKLNMVVAKEDEGAWGELAIVGAEALFQKGWLRIIPYGNNIAAQTSTRKPPTPRQKKELFDKKIEYNRGLVMYTGHDDDGWEEIQEVVKLT